MKNRESKALIQEDECSFDDWYFSSANLPYSAKQFKNRLYNKWNIHAHHLPLFWLKSKKENIEIIYSSFELKNFKHLTQKEVKKDKYKYRWIKRLKFNKISVKIK